MGKSKSHGSNMQDRERLALKAPSDWGWGWRWEGRSGRE